MERDGRRFSRLIINRYDIGRYQIAITSLTERSSRLRRKRDAGALAEDVLFFVSRCITAGETIIEHGGENTGRYYARCANNRN